MGIDGYEEKRIVQQYFRLLPQQHDIFFFLSVCLFRESTSETKTVRLASDRRVHHEHYDKNVGGTPFTTIDHIIGF